MKKYKIIFLGGVPGVGKSSIAGSIAKRFGVDLVLSGDYLSEFTRAATPDTESPEVLGTSVYESWMHFGEKNEGNIIKGFESQSEIMCKGISAVIERAEKNGESIIVESLYANQGLMDTLKKNGVCSMYLYISDPETHASRLNERENYTHFKSPGTRLSAQLDTYRLMMHHSKGLFEKNGLATFDNRDFKATEEAILNYVESEYADVEDKTPEVRAETKAKRG